MSQIQTFFLPDIGEGTSEVEIIAWLKEVGEKIEENDSIVSVLTDKVSVEIPSPYSGKLVKIYHHPTQIALVNHPLFDIEIDDHCQEPVAKLALPSTRQLAKTLNVDINLVTGTGKLGRVTDEDIQIYAKKRGSSVVIEGISVCAIKRQMMKAMKESNVIPHFSYFEQVDATQLIELRKNLVVNANQRLTFMPFFIKALSLTIEKYPILNSSLIENEQIILHQEHHLSIAVKTDKGLIVPVLKNIEEMEFEELQKKYEELIHLARGHYLNLSDMKGGRITLSNFGVLGNGLWATPRITSPQVAVLALAKIQKQPFVKNGFVLPLDILNLSWSFDHRVIDGEEAAAISTYYAALIENPSLLMKTKI